MALAFRKVQSANFMVIKNVLYHAHIEKCKACSLFFGSNIIVWPYFLFMKNVESSRLISDKNRQEIV